MKRKLLLLDGREGERGTGNLETIADKFCWERGGRRGGEGERPIFCKCFSEDVGRLSGDLECSNFALDVGRSVDGCLGKEDHRSWVLWKVVGVLSAFHRSKCLAKDEMKARIAKGLTDFDRCCGGTRGRRCGRRIRDMQHRYGVPSSS